jgi:uncharacterized protein with FMN-binding domain
MTRLLRPLLPLLLAPLLLGDDAVELLDGTRLEGEILLENDKFVRIKVPNAGGKGTSVKTVYKTKIAAIVKDGDRRVINGEGGGATRSRKEVEDLIAKVGPTPPDWWNSAKLNYPPSLDLTWPEPAPGGWNNQKNVGQFIWDIIHPNPTRWQEGIKLMSHLMQVNKDKNEVVARAMGSMAHMYHDLLEDWPRAVFWWREAVKQGLKNDPSVGLAHCYFRMGSKEMAVEILDKYGTFDGSRHMSIAKLWADMGDFDKAIAMGEERAKQTPDIGYLTAGDACRLAGRFDDAVKYYQKVIDSPGGGRDIPQNKERAKASMEAVKLFEALDLKKVAQGQYTADSYGYEGPVEVQVTVAGGKIVDVKVTKHKEKQFYSALTDTPRKILDKQHVKGVDATANATITSEAIINATAKALSKGLRK